MTMKNRQKVGDPMNLNKVLATKNRCYLANRKMKPKGILMHSTGANNPNLRRYVAPDDGKLGTPSTEHWNQSKINVCVHAFIGKLKDGSIATYQILPFDVKCWGCGSGSKGSYNNTHIQFEICEDGLADATYFKKVYNEAVEFCAYLCKKYDISPSKITTHCDAHKAGYASNHGDVMHWFPKHGKNMDMFRADVKKKLGAKSTTSTTNNKKTDTNKTTKSNTNVPFMIKVTEPTGLNIRKGPGTKYDKVGAIPKGNTKYTIVEVKGSWGLLKSYAKKRDGWICLDGYTERC